jgi:hypothetical protein
MQAQSIKDEILELERIIEHKKATLRAAGHKNAAPEKVITTSGRDSVSTCSVQD